MERILCLPDISPPTTPARPSQSTFTFVQLVHPPQHHGVDSITSISRIPLMFDSNMFVS